MRPFANVLTLGAVALVIMSTVARAEDPAAPAKTNPTLAELQADSAKGKFLKNGIKLARIYFKTEMEHAAGKKGASTSKIENARLKWRAWLDASKAKLGINLYAHPRVVIEILDISRVAELNSLVKLKKGMIDWGAKTAEGYSRGELTYSIIVPKSYAHKTPELYPLVLTMHGRAINVRHPALKKFSTQRSRIVVYNNWGGDGKSEQYEAIVMAPTGRPEGFSYAKDADFARHTFYLAKGTGDTDYRVDPQGTFMEVYGDTIQLAILDSNILAGIIWRDRLDLKRMPLKPEQMITFENLRGTPLYYIADKANWKKIGKPLVEMLKAAYKAAGKPENFIYEEGGVERDANGALKGDPEKMRKFLKHRKQVPVREFQWLFWDQRLSAPLPLYLPRANYDYNATPEIEKMPLKDRCGSIKFKSDIKMVEVGGKQTPINLIEMEITESESATIFLYEGLVDLDLPITVKVNGNVVIDQEKVRRDWSTFEKVCMPRRFFLYPFVAQLDMKFPLKRRVEPKQEEKKDEKKAEDGATEEEAKG